MDIVIKDTASGQEQGLDQFHTLYVKSQHEGEEEHYVPVSVVWLEDTKDATSDELVHYSNHMVGLIIPKEDMP